MNAFHISVWLFIALMFYAGLALTFFNYEGGFEWFLRFSLVTVIFMVGFVIYIVKDVRRRVAAKNDSLERETETP